MVIPFFGWAFANALAAEGSGSLPTRLSASPRRAGNGTRIIVPERSKSLHEVLAKEAAPARRTSKASLLNFLRAFATFVPAPPLLGYALLLSAIFAGHDC